MKINKHLAALLSLLLYANDGGFLLPVFADDTNGSSHLFATSDATHLRLLASALRCQRMNMDVIANNLANANTTGFKASQLLFQDMTCDREGPTLLLKGVEPFSISRRFTQGDLSRTGEALDIAIQGSGFFMVQMPDGALAYTRDGGFDKDSQGCIVTPQGYRVLGGFQPVPQDVATIHITDGGQVTYPTPSGVITCQVQLARFANPSGLEAIGHNLYKETAASGNDEVGNPGHNGFGELQQGFLELSNVVVVSEMVNLILAQRTYDAISQAMQSAEKMMRQSNNTNR